MADASSFIAGPAGNARFERSLALKPGWAPSPPSDRAQAKESRARRHSSQRDLDFIYVGAPKSASSWLFEILRAHPGAYVVPSKSSGFFETDEERPLARYRALLDPAPATARIGEIAHDAYLYPGTARRLRETFPNVRIIACLREPGDLAQSILRWWCTHTARFGNNVSEMTSHQHFRRQMDYRLCLEPFFAEFPADQIKILFFDDLVTDAPGLYEEVCGFIGLDPALKTSKLSIVVNRSRQARVAGLTKMFYALGGVSRRLGFGKLVEQAKRAPLVEALLYSGGPAQTSPAIARAGLRERALARASLASLEKLIGRRVPASWRDAGSQ